MSDGADQPPRDFARQIRVGVERQHVANAGEQLGASGDETEVGVGASAQQPIQLLELTALAFPAHEAAAARVLTAPPMQQEIARLSGARAFVELGDAAARQL